MTHTSLEVGNQSSHKSLAKWGSALIERMSGPCEYCGSKYRCGCPDYLSSTNPQGSGAVATRPVE